MSENRLNVRLSLKYDSYENWKTRNPVLLKGEVAFTTIPEGDTSGEARELPAVLVKVGDGEHAYNDLKFISAKAADVSEWAKADTKPEYKAEDITGLEKYISDLVTDELGISIDTDTQYTITKVNDYQYKLMSKAKGDEEFTEAAILDIPRYDDTAVLARLTAIDGENGTIAGLDARLDTAESEIDTLQNQIGGLTGAMHFKGVVDVDPTTITEGYASGDVVLFNKKEYVFDATQSKFIELGDEGSLVTRDELTAKDTELKTYADAAEQDAITAAQTYTNNQIAALKADLILDCGDSNIATTDNGTDEGTENTDPQA